MLLTHQRPHIDLRALMQRARDVRPRRKRDRAQPPSRPAQPEPDVVLDVSRLHVGDIDLRIDELDARVALNARVLDLLRLDVGVDEHFTRGLGASLEELGSGTGKALGAIGD